MFSGDLQSFQLADLEAVRLLLRGGSVIDWYRLNFNESGQADAFISAQGFHWSSPDDRQRTRVIQDNAIAYLRTHFDFPIPKPIVEADLPELLMIASGKGHRQLCACSILKVMHIIHHLEARELLHTLPTSDQETFQLVEQKIYGAIGTMLSDEKSSIVEFIGGRKGMSSLYTKLLSKPETVAAQIYDKLRFRLVVRTKEDVIAVLRYLTLKIFPFNYVIPGQSKNTLLDFHDFCGQHKELQALHGGLQLSSKVGEEIVTRLENRFSASSYQVVHFVVDIPVRLSDALLAKVPSAAKHLGPVVFVQAEFQVTDQETDKGNEVGDASHAAYKARQKEAVMRRLKLGAG